MQNVQETKFSWHRSLIRPKCSQVSLVYSTVVSMKHVPTVSSRTIVSPFLSLVKENQKHPKYGIFSLLPVPVCRSCPTKIRISFSQLFPKLRIMHKKGLFHDTPVQLVQNVHRFTSCAIGRHLTLLHKARKRKTSWKSQFRFYLRLSAQKTSNQEGLLRDPTARIISK